jgi:hypothetical protein
MALKRKSSNAKYSDDSVTHNEIETNKKVKAKQRKLVTSKKNIKITEKPDKR